MTTARPATAMVSGCFDMLHSGHITFLEEAAKFGSLLVAVGSDKTITELKGRPPVVGELERLYQLRALRCVSEAFLSAGSGELDFADELKAKVPSHFVVNEDGDSPAKRALCQQLGIAYQVLTRNPLPGFPQRSTTQLRGRLSLPYRIDLAGGWLDQPQVSRLQSGSVIVASIVSEETLQLRSGLATSTRETALKLWGPRLPPGPPIERARQLFACENPPGTTSVSGSQDALGICMAGVSRLHYSGDYWPAQIERITDPKTLSWLESKLFLKWLGPRPEKIDFWSQSALTAPNVAALAAAAEACWQAIQHRDSRQLAEAIDRTFIAQTALFPMMTNEVVAREIAQLHADSCSAKLAGAGGLGYLIITANERPANSVPVQIRRSENDAL